MYLCCAYALHNVFYVYVCVYDLYIHNACMYVGVSYVFYVKKLELW